MKTPLFKKVNQWRVFPRIFSIFYAILIFQVSVWYMSMQTPTEPQTAFATIIVSSSAAWFKFYVSSGHDMDRLSKYDKLDKI